MTEGSLGNRRALTDEQIEEIRSNFDRHFYRDKDVDRLFETIQIQKRALRELFDLFQKEPLRHASTSDTVPNSQLAHLKELVSMEDKRGEL